MCGRLPLSLTFMLMTLRWLFGGGIMRSADIILPYINKWVEDRAWTPIDRVHIVLSELETMPLYWD